MIKKVLKGVLGVLAGVVVLMCSKESVKADVSYVFANNSVYGIDSETGFFVEIPDGMILPAEALHTFTNYRVEYGDKGVQLVPTGFQLSTSDFYVQSELLKHQMRFESMYLGYFNDFNLNWWSQMQMPQWEMPQFNMYPFWMPQLDMDWGNIDWSKQCDLLGLQSFER